MPRRKKKVESTKTIKRQVRATKRKQKEFSLKADERRLLLYPPTMHTWVCESCQTINPGSVTEKCGWCKTNKAKDPILLWPTYVAACEKVGVEPGMMWKQVAVDSAIMRIKGGSWKEAPEFRK